MGLDASDNAIIKTTTHGTKGSFRFTDDTVTAMGAGSVILGGVSHTSINSSGTGNVVAGGDDHTLTTTGHHNFIANQQNQIAGSASRNAVFGLQNQINGSSTDSFAAGSGNYQNNLDYVSMFGRSGAATADMDFIWSNRNIATNLSADNVAFKIDGGDADVHIGRHTDHATAGSNTNTLMLHTINVLNQSNYIGMVADSSLTSSTTYTLNNDGNADDVLSTDGSGDLTWTEKEPLNYMKNPQIEKTADAATPTGWATYADADQDDPEDGTGGSATSTFLGETTSPLRGSVMAVISKPASDERGEGASYDFTIDEADQASVMKISFDYNTDDADFSYGTNGDASDPSDIQVWVYDKDGTELIQPTPYTLDGSGRYEGYFQTDATNDDYRLILHISDDGTDAWKMEFDNFFVGQSQQAHGPAMSDWESFTPTTSFTNTSTANGYKRQIGDVMQLRYYFVFSGATANATATVDLPEGSIDTTKLDADGSDTYLGEGQAFESGTQRYGLKVRYSDTNTLEIAYLNETAGEVDVPAANLGNAAPFTTSSSDVVSITAEVPITGWSSNTLVSSDADTRAVSLQYRATSVTTVDNAIVKFDDIVEDTHNMYSVATGLATIPVSGRYSIYAITLDTSVADTKFQKLQVKIDGVFELGGRLHYNNSGGAQAVSAEVEGELFLNAGQTVGIYADTDDTSIVTDGDGDYSRLSIHKISGPAQIAASEVVAARAYLNADETNVAAAGLHEIVINAESIDTHGAFNTSTGRFTAPIAGYYNVRAQIRYNPDAAMTVMLLRLLVNGTGDAIAMVRDTENLTSGEDYGMTSGAVIKLDAGDYVSAWTYGTGGTHDIIGHASDEYTSISIHRIGGVM
jgi:hypothetical protein